MKLQHLAVLILGSTLVLSVPGGVQAQADTAESLESLIPTELGGRKVTWVLQSGDGAFAGYRPESLEQVKRLVASQGANVADVRRAFAFPLTDDGTTITVDGLRIFGTDADEWLEPYARSYASRHGLIEPRIQEREVRGREALRVTDRTNPDEIAHFYASGDTVWLVASEAPAPPLVFEAIRRIPTSATGSRTTASTGSSASDRSDDLSDELKSLLEMIQAGQFPEDFSFDTEEGRQVWIEAYQRLALLVRRARELQGPPPIE